MSNCVSGPLIRGSRADVSNRERMSATLFKAVSAAIQSGSLACSAAVTRPSVDPSPPPCEAASTAVAPSNAARPAVAVCLPSCSNSGAAAASAPTPGSQPSRLLSDRNGPAWVSMVVRSASSRAKRSRSAANELGSRLESASRSNPCSARTSCNADLAAVAARTARKPRNATTASRTMTMTRQPIRPFDRPVDCPGMLALESLIEAIPYHMRCLLTSAQGHCCESSAFCVNR